jgi:hypothetical protein
MRAGEQPAYGGNMKRLAIALLLLLSSCTAPVAKQGGLRAIPPDFGPVAWTLSPVDVVLSRQTGTDVVWIGHVAEFTYTQRDSGLVLEWICDSLPFVAPGAEAIRGPPIAVGRRSNGRFLVNLVEVKMTEGEAKALKAQYASAPRQLLVAGTVDAVVDRGGIPTVFLYTRAFELSHGMVSYSPEGSNPYQASVVKRTRPYRHGGAGSGS